MKTMRDRLSWGISATVLLFFLSTTTTTAAHQSSSSSSSSLSSTSWTSSSKKLSFSSSSLKNKLGASFSNASRARSRNCLWGYTSSSNQIFCSNEQVLVSLRGGGSSDTEDEEETDSEEYDSEDEEMEEEEEEEEEEADEESEVESSEEESEYSEDKDEYDEEYDAEEEDEETESSLAKSVKVKVGGDKDKKFDDPLVPSPMQSMSMTIGIMMACRRIDLFDPKVVRIARFAFIAYAIITQLFLAYVRIKAHKINDRTPITLNNPLSSVVQSQLSKSGSSGTNDMVKNLAGQFLSSQTTVLEYDLKQAKSMSNSLLFPLAFNWFLHFKMNQVQPLLFQTANGISNLFYSPLFQVYVLGRNLERPFKNSNPMAEKMEAMKKQQEAEEAKKAEEENEEEGESVTVEEEENEDTDDEEDAESDEEEEEVSDEEDSDEDYDSDEYDEEES